MRNRRMQELVIGLIGLITLLVGVSLISLNWMPASAEILSLSNAPMVTVTPSPSPTPTFTPTATPGGPLATPTLSAQAHAQQLADLAPSTSSNEQSNADKPIGIIADAVTITDVVATQVSATATPIPLLPSPTPLPPTPIPAADVNVSIDLANVIGDISPGIYGMSEPPVPMIEALRPTGTSWGGNNSVRYNWRAGNYWNSARDYRWQNGTYGREGMVADQWMREAMDYGINSRLTIPTVGWVAKDWWSCSYMDESGNCAPIDHYTNCDNPILPVDPTTTSIPSTPNDIREWMRHIKAQGLEVTYAAMGNEPELYGYNHYDVQQNCSTYQDVLDGHIKYAQVVREELPNTKLVGPSTCCWHFYWQSAAGLEDKAKHDYQDFLPWFLSSLQQYERDYGVKLLDVLDIHYYPEGLYEIAPEDENEEIAARRIRSVRSLWDPTYVDESWVNEPVRLLPRMKELIDTYYPGLEFGISEWNFGADTTMGGAIALADALGQFGIHDVSYAYYWRFPDWDTPGYNAFRMFTNYDWQGGRFGDLAILAESDDDMVTTYAAVDRGTGNLHIMLLNKYRSEERSVSVDLSNFRARQIASEYRYDETTPGGIDGRLVEVGQERVELTLSPYSITQIVLSPSSE